jgi:lipoprotein signal peptidase
MDIVRPRRVVVVIVSWRIGTVLLNRGMALGMIRDMLGWVYMLYMSARDTSVAVV